MGVFKSIFNVLADIIEGAIKGVFSALRNILAAIIGTDLFATKYKDITSVTSKTYNLIGEQKPNNARQEFINRAVIFEQNYSDSLTYQIFRGGAAQFLRYVNWVRLNDIHRQLGFTVDSSATFDDLGSNNVLNKFEYVPPLCLRAWTEPVNAEKYPAYYQILKKCCRKAFSDRKLLDNLLKTLEESESASDIDFAYLFFGIAINRKERGCLRYLWTFFYWLLQNDHNILFTEYNRSFNGVDPQYYIDNEKYAYFDGKYYLQFAEVNTGKGITFLSLPNTEGNVLNVPFQWRLSWSNILFEAGFYGTIPSKAGIDILGSKTGVTSGTRRFNARVGVILTLCDLHDYTDTSYEDYSSNIHWGVEDNYRYTCHYVLFRDKMYKGSFYSALGENMPGLTSNSDLVNVPIPLVAEKVSQYYTGWTIPSDEQLEYLINIGAISGNPWYEFYALTGTNPQTFKINERFLSDLEVYKRYWVSDGKRRYLYNDDNCYAGIWVEGSGDNGASIIDAQLQYNLLKRFCTDRNLPTITIEGPTDVDHKYSYDNDGNATDVHGIVPSSPYWSENKLINENRRYYWFKLSKVTPQEARDNYNTAYYTHPNELGTNYLIPIGNQEYTFSERVRIQASNSVTIRRQRGINKLIYDQITVTNLHITNYCLNGFPVDYDAVDYINFNDSNDGTCPFVIPFNAVAFKRLNALDRNEAMQLMGNILFNCWEKQTIKIRWYQRSWFKAVIQIVGIVIVVVVSVASMGSLTAPATALISTGYAALDMALNYILNMAIAMIVKLAIAKILTKITGSSLLGELIGTIAGIYTGYGLASGNWSLGMSFDAFTSSAMNLSKAAVEMIGNVGNKYLEQKSNKLKQEYDAFNSEVNAWNTKVEDITNYNSDILNSFNIDSSNYNDILSNKLWKALCDPNTRDSVMYLASDFDTQLTLEQRYVYNYAEDRLRLPDLNSYV